MSDNRSIELFHKAQEADEKFDYFLCGVAGALFAYVGQNYNAQRIGWNVSLFEPLALLFLVSSFIAGLKRIETVMLVKRDNAQMLDCSEKAAACAELLLSGDGVINAGGDLITARNAEEWRTEFRRRVDVLESKIEKLSNRTLWYYRIRNGLLIGGFLTLLAAKIIKPYAAAFPESPQ
jgi:hypothetical protein